jgi:hypothetical protein
MPVNDNDVYQLWLPVIGRALAQLCLKQVHEGDATIADRAKFLETLGLPRHEVADMLGTSYASVTELLRIAKLKKGARSNVRRKKR